VVLVDQRGCGDSLPFGELKDNNTWALVEDFEKVRKHLNIDKWYVYRGQFVYLLVTFFMYII
jgi:proline iminopeptidase